MTARSLFTKIFLWFWLANTVVIAALALVMWMYPYVWKPGPLRFDYDHEKRIRDVFLARSTGDFASFARAAEELDRLSMFRTFWLDDQGRELLGHSVPQGLSSYRRENDERLQQGEAAMTGPPEGYIVVPLRASDGKRYTALAVFKGEPGPSGAGPVPPPGQASGFSSYFQFSSEPRVLIPRLIAIVLAAGLGCYALARYLTSPVRRLQQAARRLASGDLAVRVGGRIASRQDEIGQLGREFDRMADQVDALVTGQKRLLRDVSHELRSPLARLNVALELAVRDAGPAAVDALNRAARESDRLNELIGKLLKLAHLDSGAAEREGTTIDLRELINEIAADAEYEAAPSDRHVRVVRIDDCTVVGTPDILRSAIENVVRNAVRYTAAGSDVEVSVQRDRNGDREMAIIAVRDHGPGVPEEALQPIFHPFYRVSDARERPSGGTGLGLAITQQAIRLHGGTVSASNAPDSGLIVTFRLPFAPSPL